MLVSSNRGACWGPGETHLQGPSFFGMQPAQHVLNILAVKVLYVFHLDFLASSSTTTSLFFCRPSSLRIMVGHTSALSDAKLRSPFPLA